MKKGYLVPKIPNYLNNTKNYLYDNAGRIEEEKAP